MRHYLAGKLMQTLFSLLLSAAVVLNIGLPVLLFLSLIAVLLGKIQSPCFGWDPFAGVIFKLPAFLFRCPHSFFGAEDQIILQTGSPAAVAAAFLNMFAK